MIGFSFIFFAVLNEHGPRHRCGDIIALNGDQASARLLTCGTFQLPSMIEGACSFGQYRRIISTKSPFGAGSQLALSRLPGDSFWIRMSTEPSLFLS